MLLLATLPLIGLAAAQAQLSWTVANTPQAGLPDITFPIDMSRAAHASGFYFAQQMLMTGAEGVTYTGLQPREDSSSGPVIHAVFSSFQNGTTSADANCHSGADGGEGVSCAVDFTGSYGDIWALVITRGKGTDWSGAAVNQKTGVEHHIGSFTLPSGTGGISGSQAGFVEYYPWNSHIGEWNCKDNVPHTEVSFYPPTTSGGEKGALDAWVHKDCTGYGKVTITDGVADIVIKP